MEWLRRTGGDPERFKLQLSTLTSDFDQGRIPIEATPDPQDPAIFTIPVAGFLIDLHLDEELKEVTIVRMEEELNLGRLDRK